MPVLIHFYDKPALCRYSSILHRYVYTHIYTYLCTYIYFPEGMFTYFLPIFNWNAWSLRLRSSSGTVTDGVFKDEASTLAHAFWDRIGEFLQRSLTDNELSPEEKAQWVQSGLTISPLMGTCLQYSLVNGHPVFFFRSLKAPGPGTDMRVPSFKNTKAVHHG